MKLYDTATRGKRELPQPPGPIGIYVCGPTVYARAHIGNARPFVLGMWIRSWLRAQGYDVKLVHNITDINDKIYAAAPGASAALAEEATQWYLQDTADLGLGMPDELPRATHYVPQIVSFIAELVDRGYAYASSGDVYFRVGRFPDYGRLSGRHGSDEALQNPSEEEEAAELKEDPRDFALWKAHKSGEDTFWESPWGRGRPGWHIECSVMAEELLGPSFALHGGGVDLVFPHHENEVAQSRALDHDFARAWMHNGMLQFVGEKMSKSLGNVRTIREALDEWGRQTILMLFLGANWSKPMDYSDEALTAARARAQRFREVFRGASEPPDEDAWERFAAALDDDFNTPEALAVLHSWRDHKLLARALGIFGLGSLAETADAPAEVVRLAEHRNDARSRRAFEEADRLRHEIDAAGWEVRDVDGGFQLVPKA